MPTTAEVNEAAANFIADTETADAKINSPVGDVVDRHGVTTKNLERIFSEVGYSVPVVFGSGLAAASGAFTVEYQDKLYAAKPSEVPFTTTASFDASQWLLLPNKNLTPLVILATGQSNVQLGRSFSWTPADNLYYWDYNAVVDGAAAVGDQFIPMSHSAIVGAASFANEVARANPNRHVYLLNVGYGSQAIAQWKTGAAAPDMYAACKNNVEAALALIGADVIDYLWWWQGESDAIAESTTYPFDFEEVMERFDAETWFEVGTKTLICTVSPFDTSSPSVKVFNNTLKELVRNSVSDRSLVDTTQLPISSWESGESYIHMTANGYKQIGRIGINAAQTVGSTEPITLTKHQDTARVSTTSAVPDPELKCHLFAGRSYKISGKVFGRLLQSTDFKFSLSGPAAGRIDGVTRYATAASSSVETILAFEGGFPGDQSITEAVNSAFTIKFDLFIFNVTTNGQLTFDWAQQTSGAAAASIFRGSSIEVQPVDQPSGGW